jgi:hypothetical protein
MADPTEELARLTKAVEFATYMAKGAEQLLAALNERDALVLKIDEGEDVDDAALDQAQEAVLEHATGLRGDIYEFRKRAARIGVVDRPAGVVQPPAAPAESKQPASTRSAEPSSDVRVVPDYLPAAEKTEELVTYWLWHNGACVGSKRLPAGTGAVEVRRAVMNEAVILCNRADGETPYGRRAKILRATVVVYDDRAIQERSRRELPFDLRALFPNEVPFYELTFRTRLTGTAAAVHVSDVSKGLQDIAIAEGLDWTISAHENFARHVYIEGRNRAAIGRAEVAMKACLAESGAELVSDFGVGYIPAADEGPSEPETEEERPRA